MILRGWQLSVYRVEKKSDQGELIQDAGWKPVGRGLLRVSQLSRIPRGARGCPCCFSSWLVLLKGSPRCGNILH